MSAGLLAHLLPGTEGVVASLVHLVGGAAFFVALLAVGAVSMGGVARAGASPLAGFVLGLLVGVALGASGWSLPAVAGPLAAAAVGALLLASGRGPVVLRAAPVVLFGVAYGVVQGAHASEGATAAAVVPPLLAAAGLVAVGAVLGRVADEGTGRPTLDAPLGGLTVLVAAAAGAAPLSGLLGGTASPEAVAALVGGVVDADLGVPAAVGALLAAAFVGTVHAFGPGHGKTLLAAYLLGGRGRPRHALALAAVVAAMHTASVLVVGVGVYALTAASAGARGFAAWQTLVAAVLVLAVGAGLLRRELRRRRRGARVQAAHGHRHAPPEGCAPLSPRGLLALGAGGGLLPSPTGLAVVTTAALAGRAGFGLALVAAFSLGLATTLAAVGLAVLRGRAVLTRRARRDERFGRMVATLPLAGAVAVLAGGASLMLQAAWLLAGAPGPPP